jgi:hypothetical protein
LPANFISQIEAAYFDKSSFANLRFESFNHYSVYVENLFALLNLLAAFEVFDFVPLNLFT